MISEHRVVRVRRFFANLLHLRSRRYQERLQVPLTEPGLRTFTAVIERDQETGLYVGYVPGWPGAHSQGDTLDELRANLQEVVQMLLEDGNPTLDAEFIGTQTLEVA